MDKETINVKPNEDGRIFIELYGQKLEIHKSMFDTDGKAQLKKFGKLYEIVKPVVKKKRTTRKKKVQVKPEIAIESEQES